MCRKWPPVKGRIMELRRELRDVGPRLTQADPYESVALLRFERTGARFGGNRTIRGKRRNACAGTVRSVTPAVISADQLPIVEPAERKRSTPVNAKVVKRSDPSVGSP